MATGLRWGEIAGLHVSGLDPAGCVIHVTQTYAYLLNETTSRRQWQLRLYPKGRKQRDVPICHELAILLARHANGKNPGQPLFPENGGGYIDYANQRNNVLQPALEFAHQRGLAQHITPHALRHTMITMLRDAGVAPGVMQLIAGHESYQTTARYSGQHTPAQRALILNSVHPIIKAAEILFNNPRIDHE
ncbi:tyrosine-type recombinase/integrase [Nonomuraea sp. NPDC050663]|uniref:tyrosine-type recombinase/integrase n=1 Tax=Nonomuraea sp. NPDC050663 TaxID=3364370 RepID=UPI003788F8D7